MLVSINSTEISNDKINIQAANLEHILLSEDLYSQVDDEEQTVVFTFNPENFAHKKYLYKICQGQRKTKDKKSLGEMIEALPGCILSLSEGFIE